MKPAVLFWFYKDLPVCENHLRHLRRRNPDAQIFGLYGGDPDRADLFRGSLDCYLDDFFCFQQGGDVTWKWLNGDILIREWYRLRGRFLSWDSIFVVQWDMLVFGELGNLFDELKPGEILLSGLRPLRDVKDWWHWTTNDNLPWFEYFMDHVRAKHGFDAEPLCCQFVVVCFPRVFLEQYADIEDAELGFIEYRIPIYGQIFGIPFASTGRFHCQWENDPALRGNARATPALSAGRRQVPIRTIISEVLRTRGETVIHPVRTTVPIDLSGTKRLFVDAARSYRKQLA